MAEEELYNQRLEKISLLKNKQINPYPTKFVSTSSAETILKENANRYCFL